MEIHESIDKATDGLSKFRTELENSTAELEERKEAKKNKDFSKADAIRDELLAKGIKLLDTREGTTYKLED